MTVQLDVQGYRFADRFVAARSWALIAGLVERNPELVVSAVVAPDRAPLLICHSPDERIRIQFDMVAWLLFGPVEGPHAHLYWDEVFAQDILWSILHVEAACGLVPSPRPATPRAVTYATIASLLAAGVDDEDTWQVRTVPLIAVTGGEAEVLNLFPAASTVVDTILSTASNQPSDTTGLFHEPLWALWRAGEPVLLLDSSTGVAHLTTGVQLDLVGEPGTSTAAQHAAQVFARLPELGGAQVEPLIAGGRALSAEDLGLSGAWSLEDFEAALPRYIGAANEPDGPPANPSPWARTVWVVAEDIAAGASFERVVSHRGFPSDVVAAIWEPLVRPVPRVDGAEGHSNVPGLYTIRGDVELHPVAPWCVEAQAWQLATDLEERCEGLQIAPGTADGERLRLVDALGSTVATFSDQGVRSASGDPDELSDWFDVFAAELPGTVADRLSRSLGSRCDDSRGRAGSASRSPAQIVHRWIAQVLATQVHAVEPWSALAAHHPLHGTAWVLRRGAQVVAVADETTATLLSRGEPLGLSGSARRPSDQAWAALAVELPVDDDAPTAPESATLWDANGLHVSARRGPGAAVIIEGQDLSGGSSEEYAYAIEITDVEALEQALGGSAMGRLESRGAEIVAAGESTWLTEHGVRHALVVLDGGPPFGGNPVRGAQTYFGTYSERFGLLAAYAVYAWPPGRADAVKSWPPRRPDAPYRAAFCWTASTWMQVSFAHLQSRLDDYDVLSGEITLQDLARDVPDAVTTALPVVTGSPQAQVAKAEAIAAQAHAGQVDKNGEAYLRHPAAVAGAFDAASEPVECAAAWLHDVVEDTGVGLDELRRSGIQEPVLEVVELLTRTPEVPDQEYYARIAAHPAARRVKLADIANNTRPDRVARLNNTDRARLATKYAAALGALSVANNELVED